MKLTREVAYTAVGLFLAWVAVSLIDHVTLWARGVGQ